MNGEIFHKLLILRTPGIGPVKYAELIRKFGSAAGACESLKSDSAHIDMVRREMDAAEKLNIIYISDEDDLYPENLRLIKNHPPVITARGQVAALQKRAVGIVGTRHATAAGIGFTRELAAAFASRDFTVVSGMAMGTDTAAHLGALQSKNDSATIAVLAGGADYIWPLENESLYREIIDGGCVVSEMPVGFQPDRTSFVQRNRWIAGLSEILILGEADIKSGSVKTAEFMLDYARPLYAIPSHPADSRSFGPNRFIKSGAAQMCIGTNDFFDGDSDAPATRKQKKSTRGDAVLDAIGIIPLSESVLAELVKKDISEIKQRLVMLEMDGLVRKTDSGYVKA